MLEKFYHGKKIISSRVTEDVYFLWSVKILFPRLKLLSSMLLVHGIHKKFSSIFLFIISTESVLSLNKYIYIAKILQFD